MAEEKEPFLARWSRLKREKPAEAAASSSPPAPANPVPPVESLTPQSDFSPFMQPKVKEELRRLALKKLFRDPHFNAPDLFEPFSGDWTVSEPIAPDLLARLNQTRTLLMTPEERKALEAQEQAQEPQIKEAKDDEPGRQDT